MLFGMCFIANAWTGKVCDIWEIEQSDLHYEGVTYYDDHIYANSMSHQHLFRIDPEFLDDDIPNKVEKTSEAAIGLGSQKGLSLCSSDKEDRIYGCFFSANGSELGGLVMWDDDMEWKKTYLHPGITHAADCIVSDEQKTVYFTSSIVGLIVACDLDLYSCTTYVSGGDLVSTDPIQSQGFPLGVNGIEYFDDDDEPYLIGGNYDDGKLVKIMVHETPSLRTMSSVTIHDPDDLMINTHFYHHHFPMLRGVDGIVRVDDDVLICVTKERVILLETYDKFQTAIVRKVVETGHIEPDGSTGVALASDDDDKEEIELYVSFPSFTSEASGAEQTFFKMALIKFSDEDVDDLDWAGVLVASLLLWLF